MDRARMYVCVGRSAESGQAMHGSGFFVVVTARKCFAAGANVPSRRAGIRTSRAMRRRHERDPVGRALDQPARGINVVCAAEQTANGSWFRVRSSLEAS